MKNPLRTFASELRLYIANALIANIPIHRVRNLYYRMVMDFSIGTESSVFMGCRFDCAGGLSIGDKSTVNDGCFFDPRGTILIGNCVAIASGVWIITAKHDIESPDFGGITAPVQICDYAFVGRRAMILQGCVIGKGAILGAGSVLTKSIPDYEVWAGNPAKKIGERRQRVFSYDCKYVRLFH